MHTMQAMVPIEMVSLRPHGIISVQPEHSIINGQYELTLPINQNPNHFPNTVSPVQ